MIKELVLGAILAFNTETYSGTASYYGDSYNGRTMFCGGIYRSSDTSIAAVGPARYHTWGCGTELTVRGPAGTITVITSDRCRACRPNDLDLSESGFQAVCGSLSRGRCDVEIYE